ncbi:MAG: rRNA pseudouridine synthase [Hyphomonadaceae bacterium]|nr:rRNA pseudouridine synthase [Clostridia bacterium]
MRLQKYMALAGVASRRKAEEMILAGQVTVNGQPITQLGTQIDEHKDIVTVNGAMVQIEQQKVYIMLNKPSGTVTTANDQFGRKTVLSLIPNQAERLYPVGRLDYHTEGLLLLTNDGELTYRLTHPKHHIDKVYQVTISGILDEDAQKSLCEGVLIDDRKTSPAHVAIIETTPQKTTFHITIHEGRNRQVRKMCEAVGAPCVKLSRIQLGVLSLGDLKVGEFRNLTHQEIAYLNQL